jgi:hypothetical protein
MLIAFVCSINSGGLYSSLVALMSLLSCRLEGARVAFLEVPRLDILKIPSEP